jgi:hypothetical protein
VTANAATASAIEDEDDQNAQGGETAEGPVAAELASIPLAPTAAPGQGATTVDGVTSQSQVTFEDGSAVVRSGSIASRITALDANGNTVNWGSGRLDLAQARVLRVVVAGMSGSGQIEVWMMSTPRLLGTLEVGADGQASGEMPLMAGIETGAHRLVLAGVSTEGHIVQMAFGITLQGESEGNLRTELLLFFVLIIAALLAIGAVRSFVIKR